MQTLIVNFPEYSQYRIILQPGYKFINMAAPANGLAYLLPERKNAPGETGISTESKPKKTLTS